MSDETFEIRIVSDDIAAGLNGGSKKGSTEGIVGFGAKLAAGFTIWEQLLEVAKDTINNILGPIKSILKAIFSLIGELIRPIADIIVILLRPLLTLLKPIIDVFRTFMAPFMDIARGFADIARGQIEAGNIGGAMQTSIQAVNTILGPFIVSIVSIALQLASTLIIGAITFLINDILELLKGVLGWIPGVGDMITAGLTDAQNAIQGAGATASNWINQQITTETQKLLKLMQDDAQGKLDEFKGMWGGNIHSVFVEIPDGALAEMQKNTKTKISGPDGIVPVFKSGLDSMSSAADSFASKMKSIASSLKSSSETVSHPSLNPVDPYLNSLLNTLGLKH